jgi:hypothetical protein
MKMNWLDYYGGDLTELKDVLRNFIDEGIENIFEEEIKEIMTIDMKMIEHDAITVMGTTIEDLINYEIPEKAKPIYIETSVIKDKTFEKLDFPFDKYSYFRNYIIFLYFDIDANNYILFGCYKRGKERDLVIYFSSNIHSLISYFIKIDKKYRLNLSVSLFGRENMSIIMKNAITYYMNKKVIVEKKEIDGILITFLPKFKGINYCFSDDKNFKERILKEVRRDENLTSFLNESLQEISFTSISSISSSSPLIHNDFIEELKEENYRFIDKKVFVSLDKKNDIFLSLNTLHFLLIVFNKMEEYKIWIKEKAEKKEINIEDPCFIYDFFNKFVTDEKTHKYFQKILANMLEIEISVDNYNRKELIEQFEGEGESLHFLVEKFLTSYIEFLPLISLLYLDISCDEETLIKKLDEIYENETQQEILELFLRTIIKILHHYSLKQFIYDDI